MIICGIQIHHEPSVCVIKDGKIIWYQEERKLSKLKKISLFPYRCIDLLVKDKLLKINKFVVTGYNFLHTEVAQIENYLYYKNILPYGEKIFGFYSAHHLAHAYKSYIDSNFKKARIFVVDGRGSDWYLSDKTETFETCSVYNADETGIKCIYKKVYSRNNKSKDVTVDLAYYPFINKPWINSYESLGADENTKFEISNKLDLGSFYADIASHFNFKDEEGKFMGYQSYGKFDQRTYDTLKKGISRSGINRLPRNQNVAHTAQIYFEKEYEKLVEQFKCENMVFTGGTALNVVNNYKLTQKFKDSNLWFDPLCGDVGNSIGVARLYVKHFHTNTHLEPLTNLYISSISKSTIEIQNTEKIRVVGLKDVMCLLEKGEVVALYQGRSEAGPRALGHRSLLLDPTIPDAKDIMNKIKKREGFRPFACSILEEKCEEWFEMEGIKKSPFMMYAFQAKKLAKEKAPSIVHIDNTCRVQTVNENDNKVLYKILKEFKVPLIINTSMNLAGNAINETLNNALYTMRNSSLKYIYMPEQNQLIEKFL